MTATEQARFDELYNCHLGTLKLRGMSGKAIDSYARADFSLDRSKMIFCFNWYHKALIYFSVLKSRCNWLINMNAWHV
jgi:hypothetical protein